MPHPALMEPLRRWDPEQIGGYVLVGRLGAGAMGQVYLGRSAAGRMVAVKTIKIEFAEEPDFRTRFAQEVAAARRVSGAFTAAVVAADPEADVPWLATAYVPAPSLSTLVRACGPLSGPAVRWLAAGCAEALESIHGAGLVHRDLKPSNVLVSPDGPRVIDFGVARAAERIQLTVTRGAVGTPAYMAPEQARDTRQATMASDVYSLGATMLFAATGHGPYQGDTVMDVLVQLATEPPDLTGLLAELAEIVVACLQRDPRKRPSSASVLAHMAPDIDAESDGMQLGRSVLSGQALTMIAEYRRDPRSSAKPGTENPDEDTIGSLPPVGAPSAAASGLRAAAAAGSGPGGATPGSGGAGAGTAGRDGRRRSGTARPGRRGGSRVPIALASAAAAIVLVAGGAGVGAYLAGGRAGRPASPTDGRTDGPSASGSPTTGTTGFRGNGPPPGAGGPPPGAGGPPPAGFPISQNGKPVIAIMPPFGDTYTIFVVQGSAWRPFQPLTITLVGFGRSPIPVAADSAGHFSYAINQGHEFVRGRLLPGTYHVMVSAPGSRLTAVFVVNGG